MKHLVNITTTLIITLSFLLSASGFIFHYHLCKKSNIKYVSIFMNANQEYCHCCDSSHNKNIQKNSCCNSSHNTEKQKDNRTDHHTHSNDSECCGNHSILSFSTKISDAYNISEHNTIPRPLVITQLYLLSIYLINQYIKDIDYQINSYEDPTLFCNSNANYGKIVSIRNCSLKLHC